MSKYTHTHTRTHASGGDNARESSQFLSVPPHSITAMCRLVWFCKDRN